MSGKIVCMDGDEDGGASKEERSRRGCRKRQRERGRETGHYKGSVVERRLPNDEADPPLRSAVYESRLDVCPLEQGVPCECPGSVRCNPRTTQRRMHIDAHLGIVSPD